MPVVLAFGGTTTSNDSPDPIPPMVFSSHMTGVTISLDYSSRERDPQATLTVPAAVTLRHAALSVSNRKARNGSFLYQQRHKGGSGETRHRPGLLSDLNIPIPAHYLRVRDGMAAEKKCVFAFTIGDLTANLLRPHYDASIPEDHFPWDRRMFFLAEEPFGDVPYSLLVCSKENGGVRFSIRHEIRVRCDGTLVESGGAPHPKQCEMLWWAACPPLLSKGEFQANAYAHRDYDLRHVFGKKNPIIASIWQQLEKGWQSWCAAVDQGLEGGSPEWPEDYNSALGVSDDRIVIIHRRASVRDLAEQLRVLGMKDAVLLDTGGSCAIWVNWTTKVNLLACAQDHREARGAVAFAVLDKDIPSEKR